MGFFKRLSQIFSASGKPEPAVLWMAVKCHRCGEIIRTRVDLRNDLSIQYEPSGPTTYFCRKIVMSDSGNCFQRIEVELTFDANRRLQQKEITGGMFVET